LGGLGMLTEVERLARALRREPERAPAPLFLRGCGVGLQSSAPGFHRLRASPERMKEGQELTELRNGPKVGDQADVRLQLLPLAPETTEGIERLSAGILNRLPAKYLVRNC